MAKECECPEVHSITKLGHCRTCPFFITLDDRPVTPMPPGFAIYVCGSDRHRDGTPHDFSWATYADETTSYGVCMCGLDDLSHSMLTMP